ncbi:MAG: hypothetical protein HKN16_02050, partial [Saprospiraceae bacterium]|nr:hypothetical protein [Saprospiraceae bacterium]
MKKNILLLIIFAFAGNLSAQDPTVGLISYKPWVSYEGYNLIFPHNQPDVILLDNCGEVVHRWEGDAETRPGNTAYLREDGNLVKASRPASVAGNPIWAGGGGGSIDILDWDGNSIWNFTLNDEFDRLHHDIAVMPNGNILAISWELKTNEESLAAGRDTALLSQEKL